MGNSTGKPVVVTNEVCLDHFKLLRVVGKGAFGKVRIVERKDSGMTFALKYIRKDAVVRSENVRNIVRERRMLEQLNHPFLCNLRYSFQDFEYLYLVIDLMNGGDLRFHIDRKTFTEEAIRFWLAELGSAVQYIHSQGIVHRDIKPDNVMLDSEGHVHLADFNVASEIAPNKLLTSKSGTLAYLAPEVYEGKGYSSEVDWWSLGVVFYECVYSKRPFEGSTEKTLSARIRGPPPPYPATIPPVSKACEHAMQSLLCKRSARIGAKDFVSFSRHPFFESLDFDMLEKKRIAPIFIPSSEKANFDATHDLEELLLEEAPLEARVKRNKSRAQPRPGATDQEVRAAQLYEMIERLFEPFDYTTAKYEVDSDAEVGEPSPSDAYFETDRTGRTPAREEEIVDSDGGTPPLTRQLSMTNMLRNSSPTPSHQSGSMDRERSPALTSAPTSAPSFSRPFKQTPTAPKMSNAEPNVLARRSASRTSVERIRASNDAGPSSDQAVKPAGFLGFLSKKKRERDRSPKVSKMERGVLGKEGARIPIPEKG